MGTYTIGEVAERSGFTASALRYYEGIGLLAPAPRTDAGYRRYDDATLERLAFVARAKQLGCSLDEITDLVALWDGRRCGPVQQRLHRLVTDRIGDARRQVAELTALTEQLRTAAARLAGPAVEGPCRPGCACLDEEAPATPEIACTLPAEAVPQRLTAWRAVLGAEVRRTTTADGALRIELDEAVDPGELAHLVAAEQGCCAFLSFTISFGPTGTALEVRAPEGAGAVVEQLLGSAPG